MPISSRVYPDDPVDKLQTELLLQLQLTVQKIPLPEGTEYDAQAGHAWLPSGISPTQYRRLFRARWEQATPTVKLAFYMAYMNGSVLYAQSIAHHMSRLDPESPALRQLRKQVLQLVAAAEAVALEILAKLHPVPPPTVDPPAAA